MRKTDQEKYFEALRRYEKMMDNKEFQDYSMLFKRHKMEEDLDNLSFERLKALYQKYYMNRAKKNFDQFFKKPNSD
ncbi:MAG: hypothetical protein KJ799_05835 [Bacteroidetes bacterium]|nr:hypothetical protein [Bacteroidota bacterium]MBU1679911.1 hypothetical protein [Bacteroidota bacterium]MBU2506228.1 hypothetical protein [Bacteroidota bacterium]